MANKQEEDIAIIDKQPCPMCREKKLTLTEMKRDIPYFGHAYIYSMDCSSCNYRKADVEFEEQREPCKISFELESEEDLKVRVVKSSEATIKIPHIITIESGPSSNGYITNIEGILNRIKNVIETQKETEEDADARKKAKKHLKKINKALWGQDKIKITIEDSSGNSAIISEKAKVTKLKQ